LYKLGIAKLHKAAAAAAAFVEWIQSQLWIMNC